MRGGGARTGGYRNRVASSRRGPVQELKFWDLVKPSSVVNQTWTEIWTSVNLVQQGANADQRIGRNIWIKGLNIKGDVKAVSDSLSGVLSSDQYVRVAIVLDTQCNGASPASTDIWESTDIAGTAVPECDQWRNLEKSSRFRILYDKVMQMNQFVCAGASGNTLTGAKTMRFKVNKKMNLKIEFDSSTGFIGDLSSNNISVWAVKNQTANTVDLSGNVRIRFDG